MAEMKLPAEKALPSKRKSTKRLTERIYIWECAHALDTLKSSMIIFSFSRFGAAIPPGIDLDPLA
jgi:hypothetical protein